MSNIRDIKQMLKPTAVAQYYLGLPDKTNNLGAWYKSPFRNEKTASFLVNDVKGIHDFGTSEHYDIFSFVQALYKIDFGLALKKICRDFGIDDRETVSKELNQYWLKQREEELAVMRNLDCWFYATFGRLCDKIKTEQRIAGRLTDEAKGIVYHYISDLEYWVELFLEADGKDKARLYKSRKEIEQCLKAL